MAKTQTDEKQSPPTKSPQSKKTKNKALLGMYLEKYMVRKGTYIPVFTAVLFTIAGTWRQPKFPSMEEWIKKMKYIYTMEYTQL